MKIVLVILCLFTLLSNACKLEASSSTPNANSHANTNTSSENSNFSALSSSQSTQSNCSLTLAAAPVLNGLHLGMTPDEVLALFPGSKEDAEVKTSLSRPASQFGVSSFVIRPAKFESKDKPTEINQISFSLLDGRVSSFSVGYNGPAYSHVDKFVEKFVAGTNLPAVDQWQAYVGLDNQLKILTCKNFEVRVFAGGQGGNLNYVLIKDLEADKKLKDRRAKARAQASPTP